MSHFSRLPVLSECDACGVTLALEDAAQIIPTTARTTGAPVLVCAACTRRGVNGEALALSIETALLTAHNRAAHQAWDQQDQIRGGR